MTDREKIIKAFEIHNDRSVDCTECPYNSDDSCLEDLMEDVLALLKEQKPVNLLREQEAVKPVVHITNANLTNGADFVCGECGSSFLYKAVNFCPWCGKKVKWDADGA